MRAEVKRLKEMLRQEQDAHKETREQLRQARDILSLADVIKKLGIDEKEDKVMNGWKGRSEESEKKCSLVSLFDLWLLFFNFILFFHSEGRWNFPMLFLAHIVWCVLVLLFQ